MIRIQECDFDSGLELAILSQDNVRVGGVCGFIGLVRDFVGDQSLQSLTLEHYSGMTERALKTIEQDAHERWSLESISIIHRVGKLDLGDQIVFVGVASAHRKDAFEACQFVMDWLKTKAPFWKKETGQNGTHWVAAKLDDDVAQKRWNTDLD